MGYWLEKMDRLPPNVCRLIAREPHKSKVPRTTETIAKFSGFSKQKVLHISRLRTWKDVTVGDMEAFKLGCGLTPGRECIQVAYIKRSQDKNQTQQSFYHLRRLMKQKKDQRIERFLVDLMLPKNE
jgi:hypothetical protein